MPVERKQSSFQFADNVHRDTSEAIVELYYQCKGYITSSNKWIRYNKNYTDIDVLAVNNKETNIVSVSTNLDDKELVGLDRYFKAVVNYFGSFNEYKWLLDKEIKKVLAVFTYEDKKQEKIKEQFKIYNVEILYAKQIFDYFRQSLVPWRKIGLKTENPLVKTIQLVDYFMRLPCELK